MATAAVLERETYLNSGYGLKSWLLTKDHKRIAVLYFITISIFFAIGGTFAGLIRLELLTPQAGLVSSENQSPIVMRPDDAASEPKAASRRAKGGGGLTICVSAVLKRCEPTGPGVGPL